MKDKDDVKGFIIYTHKDEQLKFMKTKINVSSLLFLSTSFITMQNGC